MKKLLVIAFTMAMAAVANAAVINWEVSSVWTSDGTGALADQYLTYFISSADYSRSAAVTAISKADTSFVATYAREGIDGIGMLTDGGYIYASEVGEFDVSTTVTGYLVIFDAATISDATYAFVSEEASTDIQATGAADDLAFGDLTATQVADNWTAVPEPTSGLLLLVGGALLALKRRRA